MGTFYIIYRKIEEKSWESFPRMYEQEHISNVTSKKFFHLDLHFTSIRLIEFFTTYVIVAQTPFNLITRPN